MASVKYNRKAKTVTSANVFLVWTQANFASNACDCGLHFSTVWVKAGCFCCFLKEGSKIKFYILNCSWNEILY